MEENRQKNSKRRLNSLILLVAFTAIMLIVSTYAWFSTQRSVSISNLEGTVKVAEGLEISLDANNWSQEIDFSQYTPTELKKQYGDAEHNVVPSEMIPASSNGKEGIGADEIPFYRGIATQVSQKWQLAGITAIEGVGSTKTASDVDFPGYYAIDLFLRNSGIISPVYDEEGTQTGGDVQGTTKETLQLTSGSTVTVKSGGDSSTGLQNTPRVAFALYDGSADVTANQSTVLGATTGDSVSIDDVAIWEPNANAHVNEIVTNYNDITWKTGDPAGYLAATVDGNGKAKYTGTEIIPTYALTATSATTGTYADLYNWNGTTNAGLSKQISLQTVAGATAGVKNLISVNSPEASIYTKNPQGTVTEFQMLKNTTLRIRMYVWLEGQDPDCVNYASHGGGIELDLGLCKGETVGS